MWITSFTGFKSGASTGLRSGAQKLSSRISVRAGLYVSLRVFHYVYGRSMIMVWYPIARAWPSSHYLHGLRLEH